MEYLPEKKRTQQAQILKHERKIHDFREYLCDSEVVLAVVKYLIAVRSQPKLPDDPHQHLLDYFGNQRSPLWDTIEDMQDENAQINEDLPRLGASISELEAQLEAAKRKTECFNIHKQCDLGNMGMKAVVQKLNGDPKSKFDVDHKMNPEQFHRLIMSLSTAEQPEDAEPVDPNTLFDQYCSVMRRALCEGAEPFKGDLENVTYKNIIAAFRAFDPNAATD